MKNIHRNLRNELSWKQAGDGRWLVFGEPPDRMLSQGFQSNGAYLIDARGDERQIETLYAKAVLEAWLKVRGGRVLTHVLDCGAAGHSEAQQMERLLRPHSVVWSAVDVRPVVNDVYDEVWEGTIGECPWTDFDLILCVSTLEHCGYDCSETAIQASKHMRKMLGPEGIAVITVPLGVPLEFDRLGFTQYSVVEFHDDVLAGWQVINERFWRWNGRHYENCDAEDTLGALYGVTNGVHCAAAVGAWTVC